MKLEVDYENSMNKKILQFGNFNFESEHNVSDKNVFKRTGVKIKSNPKSNSNIDDYKISTKANKNTSDKNFFVFGKNSKQSDFKTSTSKNLPVKITDKNKDNERYPISIHTDGGNNDNYLIEHYLKVNFTSKNIEFDLNKNYNTNKVLDNNLKIRPNSSFKKSVTVKNKSINKKNRNLHNNDKHQIHEQNLILSNALDLQKPLINEVLNIEFSKDDKVEYTPFASKNRLMNRPKSAVNFKSKINTNLNKTTIKSKANANSKTSNKLNNNSNTIAKSNFIIEENLKGDNMQLDNEASFEESNPPLVNLNQDKYSSDNLIKTINLISKNPDKFKQTNKILKSLGQFTKSNLHILYNNEQDKQTMEKAMKDFENAEQQRQKLLNYTQQVSGIVSQNEKEFTQLKNSSPDAASSKQDLEQKSRLRYLINSAKEDSKVNKSFDINKLSKKDREILTSKLDYVYKSKEEPDEIHKKAIVISNADENEVIKSGKSPKDKHKSSARKIIEGVIDKIEGNNIYLKIIITHYSDSNKKYMEYLERRSLNGFVLKAYTNLYSKGKHTKIEKIKKEENKTKVNKEDIYDHVYFSTKKNKPKDKKSYHPFLANEGYD